MAVARSPAAVRPRWRPAVFALLIGPLAAAVAQVPSPRPPVPSGLPPLPMPVPGTPRDVIQTVQHVEPAPLPLPGKPPRPATGPGGLAEFLDGLSQNDAMFEVLVGQGRILTTKVDLAVRGKTPALVALGDPSVADFTLLSTRQIRIEGRRVGVTDLSIVTPNNETYSFEVRVVADLNPLRGQLHTLFPDATLKLTAVRDHVVVEGQARDAAQVARIMDTVRTYLLSITEDKQARRLPGGQQQPGPGGQQAAPGQPGVPVTGQGGQGGAMNVMAEARAGGGGGQGSQGVSPPKVINLITVPGSQQVLLQVRVAELNRTAFRQIGSDFLIQPANRSAIGTQIAGSNVSGRATIGEQSSQTTTGSPGGGQVISTTATAGQALAGFAQILTGSSTTGFGIFSQGDFAVLVAALRRNQVLKLLAEPNLVSLNGHKASFLAGGEFPIPIAQASTGGGGAGGGAAVTVQFKTFGVQLEFVPTILDNGVIRLSVAPEVSSIDTSIGTVLVPGGSPVPGIATRRAQAVVEMREGQTLAMAGLLQVTMDGTTQRIPGLGDLPILGPFFRNTTNNRTEKELIVMVTPYLIEPMNPDQVPPVPGQDVTTPSDLEFYALHRIEGRTGRDNRATILYERQTPLVRCLMRLDAANVRGPHGFCD